MFLFVTFLLIACLPALADDGPKTVTLTEAGTLSTLINNDEKETITSLKVSGPINGTDVRYLREMAGSDYWGNATNGQLVDLDLTDANIVDGGDLYCSLYYSSVQRRTTANVLGDYMFFRCKLRSIELPNSVTHIGQAAFYECKGLKSVTIPNTVTSIGNDAFHSCTGLESVTIPNSVTSIGWYAFMYCSNLTSVTIPDKVKEVSFHLFYGCSGLTSVTIPSSVTKIDDNAFWECKALKSVTIPDKVKTIGRYAFYNCTGLESVTIGSGVEEILEWAFYSCSSLKSVTIPDKVKIISQAAFSNCSSLASVTIGSGVTQIIGDAFLGCSSLTSITIPSSVTYIGYTTFKNCTGLTEVTLQGNTLPDCKDTFDGVDLSKATLYCKTALVETCQDAEPWKNFKNIKTTDFFVTISDAGIATACSDKDLDFSELTDVKAYIASGFSPSAGKVLLTRTTYIPANTGFMVKGSAGTYEIPVSETDYTYANLLVGTLVETTVETTDGSYTNYVLRKGSDGVAGFYVAGNKTVPANKAYLQIPTSAVTTDDNSEAKASLSLSFDDADDTTGITQTREQSDRTSGKTVIYNLNGQRKQSLTKGLNIVNGKKIFVK